MYIYEWSGVVLHDLNNYYVHYVICICINLNRSHNQGLLDNPTKQWYTDGSEVGNTRE